MTFNYDEQADALAIVLRSGMAVRTEQLDPGTLVDLDEQGRVVAIEVIRPARRWPLSEVLETFAIDDEDADVLRALWAEPKAYPFAGPPETGAWATTSREFVPA